METVVRYFPEIKKMSILEMKTESMLFQEAMKAEENGNVEDMLGNNEQ
jgi:hypothetical protein